MPARSRSPRTSPDPRPNFVVILADEVSYADIAAYGSERNRAPHLDHTASEGLRFMDSYSNSPMCFQRSWKVVKIRTVSAPLDGRSPAPVRFGGREVAPRTLFWRMRSKKAVREEQWKLVQDSVETQELYDLTQDFGEGNGLAEAGPEVVQELATALADREAAMDADRNERPRAIQENPHP